MFSDASQKRVGRERWPFSPWVVALVLAGLVLAGCTAYHETTVSEPVSAELDLCRRFMALKNAHDPAAYDLLGPAPKLPHEAISPDEAAHIDTDTFLRGELRLVEVRPDGSGEGSRFILLTKGSGVGNTLYIRSGDKVDRVQRVVTDAALLIEVRNGKIHGVKTQLPPA